MSARTNNRPVELAEVLAPGARRRPWRLLYLLLGVLLLGLIAMALIGGLGNSTTTVRYKHQPVTRGDLKVHVTATGTLQPVNQVDVGTEVSGTIESVAVEHNARVRTGEILARLDTSQLEARLRQSQAALVLAQARVEEARATVTETSNRLRRTRDLIAKRLSSDEELDTTVAASARAEASLAVARAQVDQAQAELDANQRVLDKASIRSPIDGIVLKRSVEPGQTVAASLQTPVLFTLAESLAQMELHVDVDEADVGQVAEGQGAEFTVDAYPERRFPARIEQVRFAPKTVEGVVTYETVLSVDNAGLLLRPGMTATAEIRVAEVADALLVPNAALRFRPPETAEDGSQGASQRRGMVGMLLPRPPSATRRPRTPEADPKDHHQRVWVLREGRPEAIAVRTGATDGILTEILEGPLEPGMEVLVDTLTSGRRP